MVRVVGSLLHKSDFYLRYWSCRPLNSKKINKISRQKLRKVQQSDSSEHSGLIGCISACQPDVCHRGETKREELLGDPRLNKDHRLSSRPCGCIIINAVLLLSFFFFFSPHHCLHIAEQINCQNCIVCTLFIESPPANWLLGNPRGWYQHRGAQQGRAAPGRWT